MSNLLQRLAFSETNTLRNRRAPPNHEQIPYVPLSNGKDEKETCTPQQKSTYSEYKLNNLTLSLLENEQKTINYLDNMYRLLFTFDKNGGISASVNINEILEPYSKKRNKVQSNK
jgi:hypothetical protein